jgi:uncharacterized protein YpmS
MISFNQNRKILLAVAALIFASLACNLLRRDESTPVPTETAPAATEEIQLTQEPLQPTLPTDTPSSQFILEMDENQMTSLVASELQNQTDPQINDPQVRLRNGQIEFEANVNQSGLSLPLRLAVAVTVGDQGKPDYEITSANLGPLPLPESILEQFSKQLDLVLADQLTIDGKDLILESITIQDGLMTATGHTR